jgi:hypothetical protein
MLVPIVYTLSTGNFLECWISLSTNAIGYQFDYVFDWTALKYPQTGSNNITQVCLFNHIRLFLAFGGLLSW